MNRPHRTLRRLLFSATVLATVATGQVARAQQDNDDEDNEAGAVIAQPAFMLSDQNFDQWVYGGGRNAASARSRLDSLLALQVEDVERTCALTEAQKKKLQLAGRGDVKRFFDRVEDKRRSFQLVRNDRNKFNEFYQELQPLQLTLSSGPFGEGSIFLKTLKSTLNDEQAAKYQKVILDKKMFRYRSKVELAVAMLDNSVGLSAEQRRKFVKVLLEDTQPPRKFGQYDYYVVMYQASKLPEAKLKPIFDDAQWRLLTQQFTQAKGMEQFLKNGDFLPVGVEREVFIHPPPPAGALRLGPDGRVMPGALPPPPARPAAIPKR
jgi:hypothetical protein